MSIQGRAVPAPTPGPGTPTPGPGTPAPGPLEVWEPPTTRLITDVRSALVRASGPARAHVKADVRHGRLVPVARGIHLSADCVLAPDTPWDRRRVVDVARIMAVQTLLAEEAVFCRESSLVLLGFPLLAPPDEVHVLTAGRQDRMRAALPPVAVGGTGVAPAARIRLHHGVDEGDSPIRVAGLQLCSPDDAVIGLARFSGARHAVCSISMVLHDLTQFDRRQPGPSRAREHAVKQRLLDRVDRAPGTAPKHRARALIGAADAACDSIAEAAVVWFLHAHGARAWQTQCGLLIAGTWYFPDFIFPEVGAILEVDGFSKLGNTDQEVRRNASRQLARGSELEAAGWRVIHIPASLALGPPPALLAHLMRVAPELFGPPTVPSTHLQH